MQLQGLADDGILPAAQQYTRAIGYLRTHNSAQTCIAKAGGAQVAQDR